MTVHRFRFDLVEANQNEHLFMQNKSSFQRGRLMQRFSLNWIGYILWNTNMPSHLLSESGWQRHDLSFLLWITQYIGKNITIEYTSYLLLTQVQTLSLR